MPYVTLDKVDGKYKHTTRKKGEVLLVTSRLVRGARPSDLTTVVQTSFAWLLAIFW